MALTDREIADLWTWAATKDAELTATTQAHAFARALERRIWTIAREDWQRKREQLMAEWHKPGGLMDGPFA